MLNKFQALKSLHEVIPGYPVKAWAQYRDLYLFRIEHPDPLEKNYDPFFSVDSLTGEVRDFSVITDGNISEIASLDWNDI